MAEAIFDVVDLSIDPEGTGTAASFKVDLGTGAQGPKGDTGDEGPAGADGADGESAYQLAVDAGFSGTLSQWLASLVGAKGDQGDPGTNGTDGADGSDGRGITSVARTSGDGSPGTTDTYTITYSDATTSTFTVYNGADGTGGGGGAVDSVNGQTGTVVLTASDVDADASGAASSAQTAAEGYTDSAIASEVTRADAAYATAAQGSTADSAVQPGDLPGSATTSAEGLVELATNTEATTGTDTTRAVTPAGLKAAIDALIDGAPGALDTLNEIATQLSTDESAVSALTTTVSGKLAKASNLSDLANAGMARTNLGLGTAATHPSTDFATAAQGTDARTPTAHASTHASGGTDAVALDASQVTRTTNAQTGTTYTLVLTDASKFITLTNASGVTLTVPKNSSVAFPVGTEIILAQLGAGQVTITPVDGTVTINASPGLKVAAQYGTAALKKTATDTWLAFGRLSA